jgi:hypothetical protein
MKNNLKRGEPETRMTSRICQFGTAPILNLKTFKDKIKPAKTSSQIIDFSPERVWRHLLTTGKVGLPSIFMVGIQTHGSLYFDSQARARSSNPESSLDIFRMGYRRPCVTHICRYNINP